MDKKKTWKVQSQTDSGKFYTVSLEGNFWDCDCRNMRFKRSRWLCKHCRICRMALSIAESEAEVEIDAEVIQARTLE